MEDPRSMIMTVSGILSGFLFAGFWWLLDRELTFPPDQRHSKPGTLLLLLSMILLGIFGIVVPMRTVALSNPSLVWSYRGVVLSLVVALGYMLVELGHYSIFQFPKYSTREERILFFLVLLIVVVTVGMWVVFFPAG
jgi:hypothetical protein